MREFVYLAGVIKGRISGQTIASVSGGLGIILSLGKICEHVKRRAEVKASSPYAYVYDISQRMKRVENARPVRPYLCVKELKDFGSRSSVTPSRELGRIVAGNHEHHLWSTDSRVVPLRSGGHVFFIVFSTD
jgi:hypothetical protein